MFIFIFSPIVVVLEKDGAVLENRKLMGATNPKGLTKVQWEKNMEFQLIKFCSWINSVENAKIEIDFFFKIENILE